MNNELSLIYENLYNKYPTEKEYLSSVYEFLNSINEIYNDFPDLGDLGIIERLIEPDRIITFKVPWVNDQNKVIVNTGYRVQFSNLLGPYKGGIRFDKSVNLSILKFLGFEQTLKNSLTTLLLGGAKGGSDFDPANKSNLEIMRFCQSFMNELYRHIGANTDVPAGDLGVGAKEVGYLYGHYKKLANVANGTFTGKGFDYGGSLIRPEATGYGVCYIAEFALNKYLDKSLNGQKVLISGSGNVGINAAFKAKELGAIIVGMSSITGVVEDQSGIDVELISKIQTNKLSFKHYFETYPDAKYYSNPRDLWKIKANIAIPCAKENEVSVNDAKFMIENGVVALIEGANKPSEVGVSKLFEENKLIFIPSKAANAGGVSVSLLEMNQNASHLQWDKNLVDQKLKGIMENIFNNIYNTALKNNNIYNLTKAANIASFKRLYSAMKQLGV